jgi:hypothetical protein
MIAGSDRALLGFLIRFDGPDDVTRFAIATKPIK